MKGLPHTLAVAAVGALLQSAAAFATLPATGGCAGGKQHHHLHHHGVAAPASAAAASSGGPLLGLPVAQRESMKGGYARGAALCLRAGASEDGLANPEAQQPLVAEKVRGGGFREALPTKKEARKLVPLGMMFFCILFSYTILRDTKDVLVVTAPGSGAEIIPALKLLVNFPAAILFTVVYSKLNNKMPPQKVFYTCILPFLTFFGLFATVIYPARAMLHPNAAADYLLTILPSAMFPLVSIFRNWTYALFYTMAELWGSVVVSVLFWGFANEVTTSKEAKRYYPLFGLGANVALIFSGQYVKLVSRLRAGMPAGVDKWGVSLKLLMGAVVSCGALIVGIYTYMQRSIVFNEEVMGEKVWKKESSKRDKDGQLVASKGATSMGLGESAKFLASSPYIRNLAMLVIAYGMSINIVEVTWKGKLKAAYPDPNAYSSFMGNFSTATGSITLGMMLLGRFIFTRFGWGTAALVTPTVLSITGAAFFALLLFADFFAPITAAVGLTPLMAAVFVGAAQNILSKSSKYSLFDPCKEMAFKTLDTESRVKGKAAIDVIGNPLGKSGGSFIQQVLIVSLGSLAASTPYLAGILAVICSMWLRAAVKLDGLIKAKQAETGATL
jgi:AAA family ATP:ADP antiporter